MSNVIQIQLVDNYNPTSPQPDLPDYWIYGAELEPPDYLQDITAADRLLNIDPAVSVDWMLLDPYVGKRTNMVLATHRLDALEFRGTKTDPAQPLEFPRSGIPEIDPNQVPIEICNATIYLAGSIAVDPVTHTSHKSTVSGIKSAQAGTTEVEFFANAVVTSAQSPIHDQRVYNLIKFLLADTRDNGSLPDLGIISSRGNTDLISQQVETGQGRFGGNFYNRRI